MTPSLHVFLSMSLTMGVPLAWAVRELFVMRAAGGGSLPPAADAVPDPKPLPPSLVVPGYVRGNSVRQVETV